MNSIADPLLRGGLRLAFSEDVPVEIRSLRGVSSSEEETYADEDDGGEEAHVASNVTGERNRSTLRVLRIQVAERHGVDALVRVVVTSEEDIFFQYEYECDQSRFEKIRKEFGLTVRHSEYATVIVQMLTNCIQDPQVMLVVMIIEENGQAQLNFVQNMAYRFVELLSLDLAPASKDSLHEMISYRYASAQNHILHVEKNLADLVSVVKLKHPSLLSSVFDHKSTLSSSNRLYSNANLGNRSLRSSQGRSEIGVSNTSRSHRSSSPSPLDYFNPASSSSSSGSSSLKRSSQPNSSSSELNSSRGSQSKGRAQQDGFSRRRMSTSELSSSSRLLDQSLEFSLRDLTTDSTESSPIRWSPGRASIVRMQSALGDRASSRSEYRPSSSRR